MFCKSIEIDGVAYGSIKEACKKFGVSYNAFRARLRKGFTKEESLGIGYHQAHKPSWKKDGLTIEKSNEISRAFCYTLYEIVNLINNKRYIGITIQNLTQRYAQHISFAKSTTKHIHPLYRAIQKYGEQNFKMRIIRQDAISGAELQRQEIEEITKQNTIDRKYGYNLHPGGQPGRSKPTVIKDQLFASHSEAAFFFNIPQASFSFRLKAGWTPEEAAGLKLPPNILRHTVEIDGTSVSLKEATKRLRLNYKTVHMRVKNGLSYEEALELVNSKHIQNSSIEIEGTKYASLKDAARAHNINYGTVNTRIELGWSLREALGLDVRATRGRQKGHPVEVFGITYPSLSACARSYGVKSATLWASIKDGNTLEDALGKSQKRLIEAFGQTYPSLTACAKAFGIKLQALWYRINELGEVPEIAINHLKNR